MIHGSRRSIIVIHLSDSSVCRYAKNAANQRGTFKSGIALAAHNFVIGFGLLAIAPHDRGDWALENLFPVSQLIAVLIFYCYFKFRRLSYYAWPISCWDFVGDSHQRNLVAVCPDVATLDEFFYRRNCPRDWCLL